MSCTFAPFLLYHPLYFFPSSLQQKLFPGKEQWKNYGERKMKEIWFLPGAVLDLWQQLKWQFPKNPWHYFPRNLSAKFPQIPEKSMAQVPVEQELFPALLPFMSAQGLRESLTSLHQIEPQFSISSPSPELLLMAISCSGLFLPFDV